MTTRLILLAATSIGLCALSVASGGCTDAPVDYCGEPVSSEACEMLFGLPNGKTGLTDEQCAPSFNCGGQCFRLPEYTDADIARLLAMVPVNPPAEVTQDPYAEPELHQPVPGAVCGLFLDDSVENGYRLQTFDSQAQALDAGAYITHWDGCGVCSTLTNLVV